MWGMIICHLYEEKMLSKPPKNHTVFLVGDYDQWLVSNSGRKEDLEAKTLAGKSKDRVDKLSAMSSSTTNSTRKLKKTVTAANKAADQAASKVSALKKWNY